MRKYLREGDLSERPPILEPYADAIDSWLAEDRRCWRKRRHTARRVYDRLVEEMGYGGSSASASGGVPAEPSAPLPAASPVSPAGANGVAMPADHAVSSDASMSRRLASE